MRKGNLAKKLGAYSLAAGAAVLATQAVPANAAMNVFNNGGAGWWDGTSNWRQDMLSFKMDGTVVVNTANTGLLSLGQDADSFTFQEQDFYWYGYDRKDATTLQVGDGTNSNVGYVAGGNVWNVGRLGGGYEIGDTLAGGRNWSDDSVTDTGGLGGWYFWFHGEWPFGGGGTIGLYADVGADRFYGWADISMTAYWAVGLNEFAFSDIPGRAVYAGGGEVPPPFIPIDIDIKPDSDENPINLKSIGKTPVVIFGTEDLDVADIDVSTVELNDANVVQNSNGIWQADFEDVNDDGIDDLVMQFLTQSLGILPGMTDLELTGQLLDGTELVGDDVIRIVPDFNGDMSVNGTDLAILKANFGTGGYFPEDGSRPILPGFELGDANGDGTIDATDLAILKQAFGSSGPGAGGVPEPATLTVLALGAVGLLHRRKRA
ncbi:hypothetical protein LCGC14_0525280 [marine sediment metagenome]|uniref:Ice-binding protein C-terminal domain-containing protein n=1 Tax=marine sediment metagenome TaxID=412755 RepID=A0A0F9S1X3_9ZZZZ|nr:PEP-CTERM sorting domain-containing protein [Phycisphaerae bacterium]HDZ44758.1 PEP-CTERM sorting domain-containing protein [Phycisphaerae bacterium]